MRCGLHEEDTSIAFFDKYGLPYTREQMIFVNYLMSLGSTLSREVQFAFIVDMFDAMYERMDRHRRHG